MIYLCLFLEIAVWKKGAGKAAGGRSAGAQGRVKGA